MPQITCLSPSPSARVTIICDPGHSLLLLPRGVIYYFCQVVLKEKVIPYRLAPVPHSPFPWLDALAQGSHCCRAHARASAASAHAALSTWRLADAQHQAGPRLPESRH